jgi:hypothetical protein
MRGRIGLGLGHGGQGNRAGQCGQRTPQQATAIEHLFLLFQAAGAWSFMDASPATKRAGP